AGRYGFACSEVSKAVVEQLRIPAVMAMDPGNPAVETYRRVAGLWILPTGPLASDMPNVLPRLAAFTLKVGSGTAIRSAREEGYLPSGRRKLERTSVTGAARALSMLLSKLNGRPFKTEIPIERFDQIPPAILAKDLKEARVAVITTSGLVPRG